MNKRYTFSFVIVTVLALVVCAPTGVFAQRYVDVPAGFGTLQSVILADSANRAANPNTVYLLHRGTADSVYYLDKTLTKWGSMKLQIASTGTGALPTILAATRSDGAAISPMISVSADFSIKDVALDGTNTLGSIVDRMVRIQPSGPARVEFESCTITNAGQSFLRIDNANARIFLRNCKISNISQDFSNGRAIDNRNVVVDTLWLVGNSFFRVSSRVYRDGGGTLNYAYINHNTFTEIGTSALQFGNALDVTVLNNLFVNCGFVGNGKTELGRVISLNALSSDQKAYCANNILYADTAKLYPAYRSISDTIVSTPWFSDPLIEYMTAAGTLASNISSPIVFTKAPWAVTNAVSLDSIVQYYWKNPGSASTSFINVNSSEVNLAYPTSAAAYRYATDFRPMGATNWFPTPGSVQITSNGTGGGLWTASSTWAGGVVPTGNEAITIAANDAIIFNVPVIISGSIVKKSAAADSIAPGGSITFAGGSTYEHAVDGGSIPLATWGVGSTCLWTGFTANRPSNSSQDYHNVTFNLGSGYTAAKDLAWVNNTIGGDLRFINTNNVQVRLSSPSAPHDGINTITLKGNLIIDTTTCLVGLNGSSTVDTMIFVINGDIVSNGTISMGGSGCHAFWYVSGNVQLLSGAFTGHSSKNDSLIFVGTKRQTFFTALATMNNAMMRLHAGSTVDLDTCKIGTHSRQAFFMEPGSTVITGHPLGLAGNLNNSAPKDLSSLAGYTYDGTVAQSDALLPDTVKNLNINNTAGFTLSKATVVTGVLSLQAGQLDNSTSAVSIAPGGNIVRSKGTIKVPIPGWPVTSVESQEGSVPKEFSLSQNYPNPFNPTTTISYQLPVQSKVTLKIFDVLGREIAILADGVQSAGVYTTTFDASRLSSGVYLYQLRTEWFVKTQKMVLMK